MPFLCTQYLESINWLTDNNLLPTSHSTGLDFGHLRSLLHGRETLTQTNRSKCSADSQSKLKSII